MLKCLAKDSILPGNPRSAPDDRHVDKRSLVGTGNQRELTELGLLDADIVVAVDPPHTEVF